MCISFQELKDELISEGSNLSLRAVQAIVYYEKILMKHQRDRLERRKLDETPGPLHPLLKTQPLVENSK